MAVTNSPRLGLPRWSEGTDLHPNRAEWDAQQGLLDDLVAIDVEVATYADRPSPKRGIYMWVVDEQRLYRATSTGWMTTAKIGGGGRGTPITIGAASAAVEGTSAYAARADHTHSLPLATSAVDGAMAKADKALLDTASSTANASSLVRRNAASESSFNQVYINSSTPTQGSHAARKDYVDAGDAARFPFGLDAGTGSANNILEPGQYYQASATPVTVANGYPIDAGAGSLLVYNFGSGSSNWKIQEWTDWGSRRQFIRATNGGAGAWSEWRELAGTETATASADGLLSKADKAKLDGASASAVVNSLVRRDSSGRAQFNAPVNGSDAANKTFTESTANAAASSAVNAIPLASAAVNGLMAKADKSKLDGAVSTDTASRLVLRDSAGRARFKDPLAAQDASTKAYTDRTASAAVSAIPTATSSVNGLMSSGDKTVLDSATISAAASALVKRDSSSQINVPSTPTSANHSASKSYVDAQDAKQVTAATSLGTANLDTVATDGNYIQTSNSSATTANNYPVGGTYAGLLVVSSFSSFIFQTYTVYNGSSSYAGKTFTRTRYSSNWSSWREIAFADLATTTSDGLMPSADRAALNSATYNATPNTLVQRASNGFFSILEPTSASHPANKGYVDGLSPFTQAPSIGGGDLNNYKTPGDFFASAYSNPTNVPPGFGQGFYQANRGLLSVRPFGSTSFVTQTFVDSNDIVWTRNYVNRWTPWVRVLNDLSVQSGRAYVKPTAANTPTSVRVDFANPFPTGSSVSVNATLETTVPGTTVTGIAVSSVSPTGFDLYITRTNTTGTYAQWIATPINS